MRPLIDDLDRPASRLEGPARRLRPRPLPWVRISLLSAALVAALAFFAGERDPDVPEPPDSVALAALIAPPPTWQPAVEPEPLYALEGIDASTFALEVRRHADGGREDTVTFGSFGDTGFGLLRLIRGVSEPDPGFYVALVRQAASAGLAVVRSAPTAPLATKLGAAEVAEVTLSAPAPDGTSGPEATCRAVRLRHAEAAFSLGGWICGSADQPASEAQLACLIDRLAVTGNEDPRLRVLFSEAERHRIEGCRPAPRLVSARKS